MNYSEIGKKGVREVISSTLFCRRVMERQLTQLVRYPKILTTFLFLIFSNQALAAIDEKEIALCAAKDGDLDRLECYDSIARKNGLDGPQDISTGPESEGKWQTSKKQNPIDDSITATAVLAADSGNSRFGNPIALVVRCSSTGTVLYINWQDYLGSSADVTFRIGKAAAERREWQLSTDSQATFANNPIKKLKTMLEARKLVAQVTPYNESPVTAIFDLTGIKKAVGPIRETCAW